MINLRYPKPCFMAQYTYFYYFLKIYTRIFIQFEVGNTRFKCIHFYLLNKNGHKYDILLILTILFNYMREKTNLVVKLNRVTQLVNFR